MSFVFRLIFYKLAEFFLDYYFARLLTRVHIQLSVTSALLSLLIIFAEML